MVNYKVIVIGDSFTGKTSLIKRYISNIFSEEYFLTPLPIQYSNDVKGCTLAIWDTAGSEEWTSMNSNIYHDSQAIIYLCSYVDQKSLNNLRDIWRPIIQRFLPEDPKIKIFLAVNKSDVPEEEQKIEENEIEEIKNDLKAIDTFYVSAKTNNNVKELFEAVATSLIQEYGNNPQPTQPVPVQENK